MKVPRSKKRRELLKSGAKLMRDCNKLLDDYTGYWWDGTKSPNDRGLLSFYGNVCNVVSELHFSLICRNYQEIKLRLRAVEQVYGLAECVFRNAIRENDN